MTEENKTDIGETITKDEIANIEKEVLQKDAEEKEKIKSKMEEEIRAKIAKEQEEAEEKRRIETLKKALIEKEEALQKLKEESAKREEELKKQIGSSKGYVNNDSPFNQGKEPEKKLDFKNMTQEQLMEVEKESKEAFKDYVKQQGGTHGADFHKW